MAKFFPLLLALCSGFLLCSADAMEPSITSQPFGALPTGAKVDLYTLTGSTGLEARIMTYGGIVVSLKVPGDKGGAAADVVLGFDTLGEYLKGHPFFGCIVGRYGNRIAKGKFPLEGKEISVTAAHGGHSLHGGKDGFDKKLWTVREAAARDGKALLVLAYTSPHGEEGYPGTLDCTVTYTVSGSDLRIDYAATTDRTTVVNLTNHSYFNLAGAGEGTILDHVLQLESSQYTETDPELIPTGRLVPVEDTPLDFRKPLAIGKRIAADFPALRYGQGYDHNFVVNGEKGTLRLAARVTEPSSGRVMECLTTEPGIQLYTMNGDGPPIQGKGGKSYPRRGAFCLETQHYPDSPNHPEFPSTTLKPGGRYQSTTVYRFPAVP